MSDSQKDPSTIRLERMLRDYASFLGGTIDMDAHFADWRYAEAPSFQEPFALEILRRQGRIEVRKRVYSSDRADFPDHAQSHYEIPHTILTATISEETWKQICSEASSLPIRIPNDKGINGNDGTMHSLCIGNHNERIVLNWWSYFSIEFQPVVEYASKWRDTLLALDWQPSKE